MFIIAGGCGMALLLPLTCRGDVEDPCLLEGGGSGKQGEKTIMEVVVVGRRKCVGTCGVFLYDGSV